MMVKDFYLLYRCASLKFHKFESLISFYAQDEYGSEIWEDYHNIICKPDQIKISQESYHTNGLLEKYIQHLALYHLTQHAYQLPIIIFSKTDRKLY